MDNWNWMFFPPSGIQSFCLVYSPQERRKKLVQLRMNCTTWHDFDMTHPLCYGSDYRLDSKGLGVRFRRGGHVIMWVYCVMCKTADRASSKEESTTDVTAELVRDKVEMSDGKLACKGRRCGGDGGGDLGRLSCSMTPLQTTSSTWVVRHCTIMTVIKQVHHSWIGHSLISGTHSFTSHFAVADRKNTLLSEESFLCEIR